MSYQHDRTASFDSSLSKRVSKTTERQFPYSQFLSVFLYTVISCHAFEEWWHRQPESIASSRCPRFLGLAFRKYTSSWKTKASLKSDTLGRTGKCHLITKTTGKLYTDRTFFPLSIPGSQRGIVCCTFSHAS